MNIQRWTHAVMILSLLALAFASQPAQAQAHPQSSKDASQVQPAADLASLLQPDGTLKVPEGMEGSFNVDGWQMALDSEGQPHFYPAEAGPAASSNPEDVFWSQDFLLGAEFISVPNSSAVYALAVSGNLVYVGGDFSQVGSIQARNIACWNIDTYEWSALGSGTTGNVYAIAAYDNFVYAGGSFTNAGGVPTGPLARWDVTNQSWSALGTFSYSPTSPRVDALAVALNGDLYVGGLFYYVDSKLVNHIALLNASGWQSLGGGVVAAANAEVFALAFGIGGLYVGGRFTQAGGDIIYNLARWDGSWHTVGGGVGGDSSFVKAIAVDPETYPNYIYVGGSFSEAYDGLGGHIDVNNIARWNGSGWSNMSGGVTDPSYTTVGALINHGGNICAGGSFDHAGGVPANNVACWTGSSWVSLREPHDLIQGVDNVVHALADHTNFLFLGGIFHNAGNFAANHVTAFRYLTGNTGTWIGLGSSVNRTVNAVAISGGDVYVGGYFTSASGLHLGSNYQAYLARWHIDSNTWYAVGTGNLISGCTWSLCTPMVNTILIYGDDVYIGGNFTHIGGLAVNGIAKFHGVSPGWGWSALGSGVGCSLCSGPVVRDLAYLNGNLYVGGRFDTAGGVTANNLAIWDGASWIAVADFDLIGVTGGTVYALNAVNNLIGSDYVVVGGDFTLPYPNIARWNDGSWTSIGSGLNGPVYAIIGGTVTPVGATPIYVGGGFTFPSHIARLSGSSWVAVGGGLDGDVNALAFDGQGGIYAGGNFEYAGLDTLFHVGHWNGVEWGPLGSGTDGEVNALAVTGRRLMVGGDFTAAGGKPSFFLASWNKIPLFIPLIRK